MLTLPQYTDSEIHRSPASFILYPRACSSLPYWVAAQLTCRPVSSFIHSSLCSSCSCTSKMFIMTTYDVQNSSPSSPAMIITHTAAPQSPHSHGPSSSLAPPIVCISASNEKPPLIRWPSEIIYPPPPPNTAISSPPTLPPSTSWYLPVINTLQNAFWGRSPGSNSSSQHQYLTGEWMSERDGSPDSLLSELGALDCRQALAFSLT